MGSERETPRGSRSHPGKIGGDKIVVLNPSAWKAEAEAARKTNTITNVLAWWSALE